MKRKTQESSRIARKEERSSNSRRFKFYSVLILGGVVIAAGFLFVGRQHFSSMDYGMKNSHLRRQLDELASEKQRLLLAREVAQSPIELKKAAKKAGLSEASSAAPEMAKFTPDTKAKPSSCALAPAKASVVQRTAEVKPVKAQFAGLKSHPDRIAKQSSSTRNAE